MGYKEDLHKVHLKIDRLATQLAQSNSPANARAWYGNPLFLTLVGVLGSGLLAYFVARWQVDQARQDTALDQRIDAHMTTKLQPLNEGIANIREELAYLRAKVEDVTSNKIIGFSKLPTAEIAANLPAISTTLTEARRKQLIAPPQAVKELRNKLAQVQARNPQFWTVVSAAVSYQSFIARKMGLLPDADKAANKPCEFIHVERSGGLLLVDNSHFAGCSQQLDNISFSM